MTQSASPNFIGFVDHAGCDSIVGWAADRNQLNTPITISLCDGTTMLTTVTANASRPDVGTFLGDNGMHGFSIPTPAALKDGTAHTLHVEFGGSTTDLSGSPSMMTCSSSSQPNYVGFVDGADGNFLTGWAADRNNLNSSIGIRIYEGTNLIAIVTAALNRPDVGAFLGDNGLHGFHIATPDALKTGSAHSVHVRFAASTTELFGSPASINCSMAMPAYVGFVDVANCTTLGGWVADRNRLSVPITVSVYDGSTLILTVTANVNRPDVGAFLSDNGHHGFNIPLPASLMTGTMHSVHFRFETSMTDLSGSPVSLTCP